MAEIRNLTRNGETFYPLTTTSAVINENTGEGLVIDDEPTAGSDNLVKSGGVAEAINNNNIKMALSTDAESSLLKQGLIDGDFPSWTYLYYNLESLKAGDVLKIVAKGNNVTTQKQNTIYFGIEIMPDLSTVVTPVHEKAYYEPWSDVVCYYKVTATDIQNHYKLVVRACIDTNTSIDTSVYLMDDIVAVNDYNFADLDFRDESNNVTMMVDGGEIRTKDFYSYKSPQVETKPGGDLSVEDENGNILGMIYNGHLKTKAFNSEYFGKDLEYKYVGSTNSFTPALGDIEAQDYYWSIGVKGNARLGKCCAGYTTGAAADIKCVTYENGEAILKNDKFFVISASRGIWCGANIWEVDTHSYQMKLVGNIIFKSLGSFYSHYVCPQMMYDRNNHLWIVTFDAYDGDGYLRVGTSRQDILYGQHIIDSTTIRRQGGSSPADEDQSILYDDNPYSPLFGKYILLMTQNTGTYNIFLYYCDTYNGIYQLYGNTSFSNNSFTGPCLQKIGGTSYVICGSQADNKFLVFSYPDLELLGYLSLDKDNGGYRGWGTFVALPSQNSTKYVLVTFDRGKVSEFDNWTYGTTHIYESKERNEGFEYPFANIGFTPQSGDVLSTYNPMQLTMRRICAKTYNYDQWLMGSGIFPDQYVNRQGSAELIMSGIQISDKHFDHSVSLKSTVDNVAGYINVAPYEPYAAYRLTLYNINGTVEFVVNKSDYSKYRKLIFEITDGIVNVSEIDTFGGDEVKNNNVMSLGFETEVMEVLIGIPKEVNVQTQHEGFTVYYKSVI